VAKGFFQVFGIDYTDTYSPVAKFVSIRILLAISVQLGLLIHTMDDDTAFFNATLEEDVWVQIPTGTKLPEGNNGIYKLLKSYMDSSRHQDVGIILSMAIYWRMDFSD
jgi:Reverse transcriptase (RNA-dependent DNA polymerase)